MMRISLLVVFIILVVDSVLLVFLFRNLVKVKDMGVNFILVLMRYLLICLLGLVVVVIVFFIFEGCVG